MFYDFVNWLNGIHPILTTAFSVALVAIWGAVAGAIHDIDEDYQPILLIGWLLATGILFYFMFRSM